ncbi:hypothetical protein M2427_003940 [Bradyrhizobium sp. BR13661]|nr:hypothetical protein [Bradyrhizobium sp. BR13661]
MKIVGEAQPELPLTRSNRWDDLPSAKVKRPKKSDPFSWAYTYTGYSVDFAIQALLRLGVTRKAMVLDPFVGSGTSLLACSLLGCGGHGVDISPFSLLLSRSRIAWRPDERLVFKYLKTKSSTHEDRHSSKDVLRPNDASYVEGVVQAICKGRSVTPQTLWRKLMNDTTGRFDSEVVALLSMALGARDSTRLEKGSNPIWYRRVESQTESSQASLRISAANWAKTISHDLLSAPEAGRKDITIQQHDFTTLKTTKRYDLCLTSPPYMNRLDYVVAHLPELSVLQHLIPFNLDQLRSDMIGTTRAVRKYHTEQTEGWGDRCRETLNSIYNHASYASQRYYYHIHADYFRRLSATILQLARLMKDRAEGIVVLQDSFYKDIKIPTPQICAEMLNNAGFESSIVRTTSVKAHMGRLSPAQTLYAPEKILGESVVYFSR